MILLPLVLLIVVALVPLALSLRRQAAVAGRQAPALALHRAQLLELERDLADRRIQPAEYATAVLEVQRRLLAAAAAPDVPPARASRLPLILALLVIPLGAAGLYLIAGHPELPAEPLASRIPSAPLIQQLRDRIAQLDQGSDQARQGYVLLGNIEDQSGHLSAAAVAWGHALAIRFDPDLAAQVAEAQTILDNKVSPASAALFRRALAEAPANAPWRKLAEDRLKPAP